MKITGIIAEFNPFHNGHEYILSQARKQTGCDLVVVAMSGDFVQRGAPAILDKALRAKAALLGGADLVVELPVIASTASAADFALGGVAALAACGADTLVFGCEQEDFSFFPILADFLEKEPAQYRAVLSEYLKQGYSYPLARSKALSRFFPEQEDLSGLLALPNNILALEYLRAIKRTGVSMQVCPIRRIAVDHHSEDGVGNFASATAIRTQLLQKNPSVTQFIPDYTVSSLSDYLSRHLPLREDDFSSALCYRLTQMKYCYPSSFSEGLLCPKSRERISYLDGSPELFDRILNHLDEFTTLSEFCRLLHTKECTLTRLRRLMFHILLDITQEQMVQFRNDPCQYVHVLGFRKDCPAVGVIKERIETQNAVPVFSVAKAMPQLADNLFFRQDLFARELFIRTLAQKDSQDKMDLPTDASVLNKKTACEPLLNDYRQPLIMI